MKALSKSNLERIADAVNGNLAEFSSVVKDTFDEVYANLEDLSDAIDSMNQKIPQFTYSEEDEMLTVLNGTVTGDTLKID